MDRCALLGHHPDNSRHHLLELLGTGALCLVLLHEPFSFTLDRSHLFTLYAFAHVDTTVSYTSGNFFGLTTHGVSGRDCLDDINAICYPELVKISSVSRPTLWSSNSASGARTMFGIRWSTSVVPIEADSSKSPPFFFFSQA